MAGVTPRLIVALDTPSWEGATALVERLGDGCDFYKVGSELFTAEGPEAVRRLRERGKDVFLDLKLHDIPNTVKRSARSAAALGARLLTVHASGGEAMVAAAVEGAGAACGVLAVTVLTSLDAGALSVAWGRTVEDVRAEVLRLADLARAAGAHGIVCGGDEAAAVRARHGAALALLVPGVRLAGGAEHDQARVVTPRAAVEAGARYLVLGRAVTEAADPHAALETVRAEVEGA
ncbi:MAG: orotidine-5'-phosphate decarboxylase [Gemmatimonadaceae bacterium]